jgi:hypothetical protein
MKKTELKSRVMNLGNRLAPRIGGDRATAFEKAWAIIKAGRLELAMKTGGLELAVKSETFGNRQEALKRFTAYSPAELSAAVVTAIGANLPALRVVSGMAGKTTFGARAALGV